MGLTMEAARPLGPKNSQCQCGIVPLFYIFTQYTGQENVLTLSTDRMLSRKGQTGRLTAKFCQDRVSESCIIPASQKVCQIFWVRRLEIDAPALHRILGTVQQVSCLCHFCTFGSCVFVLSAYSAFVYLLLKSLMGLKTRQSQSYYKLKFSCLGFKRMFQV